MQNYLYYTCKIWKQWVRNVYGAVHGGVREITVGERWSEDKTVHSLSKTADIWKAQNKPQVHIILLEHAADKWTNFTLSYRKLNINLIKTGFNQHTRSLYIWEDLDLILGQVAGCTERLFVVFRTRTQRYYLKTYNDHFLLHRSQFMSDNHPSIQFDFTNVYDKMLHKQATVQINGTKSSLVIQMVKKFSAVLEPQCLQNPTIVLHAMLHEFN